MSRPWAHPRSRRENMMRRRVPANGPGSSPLTPGKRQQLARRLEDQGLIPAHAGKTLRPWWRRGSRGDHPRSRGENFLAGGLGNVLLGSSPLPRGKRHRHVRGRLPGRLIPAHAGKTSPPYGEPCATGAHPRLRRENPQVTVEGTVEEGLIPTHAGKTLHNPAHRSASTAHPHSRGENQYTVVSPAVEPGSSPLTRGKHPHHARNDQRTGLIPAHAGKTSSPGVPCCASWAHPHSRGENIITGIIGVLSEGSSPLTRGKLSCCLPVLPVHGLIPAHAGKTRLRASWAWRTWAHPRLRGENPIIVACRLPAAGSSPLTQGKPMPFIGNSHPKGIIPAHAGKTRRKPVQHDRHRDHPRSRGENTSVKPKSKIAWGSSPLTRGKHAPVWSAHAGHGLIPARAWKTGPTPTRAKPSKAHPRSRGENFQSWVVSLPAPGSSPLTRGKRGGCNQAAVFVGLIPTHAGKTLRGRSPYQCPAAHPRSRGENPTLLITTPHVQGSSPLTRGKHRGGGLDLRDDGLIPTHAGKTPRSRRYGTSRWAHPHSRGENRKSLLPTASQYGSSPLTRGKHRVCVHHLIITGLIPAHAGKTPYPAMRSLSLRDHPRSRGENRSPSGVRVGLGGSSPLTRGKPPPKPLISIHSGIIPAHAGKTPHRSRGSAKPRDHPRSRGENTQESESTMAHTGSSPLTRGKLTNDA